MIIRKIVESTTWNFCQVPKNISITFLCCIQKLVMDYWPLVWFAFYNPSYFISLDFKSHSSLNSFKAYIINWTKIIYENMHIEWFFISWNKKYIVLFESEIIRLVESSIKSFIFMLSSVIQKCCHGFFRYQHNLSSNFIY